MKLHIKQFEIDTAIRLCNEYNQNTKSLENEERTASEADKFINLYRKKPDDFYKYLRELGEQKLIELAALMHYGKGKPSQFETFEQSLKHCSDVPEAARRSEIYDKILLFSEYVQAGQQHLRDEEHLPGKTE